jgi:hypothetical protein
MRQRARRLKLAATVPIASIAFMDWILLSNGLDVLERWSMTGPVTALKKIRDRDPVVVSVHHRNDRGTAVATAQLAGMAGADHGEWEPLRERSGCHRQPTCGPIVQFSPLDCAIFTV